MKGQRNEKNIQSNVILVITKMDINHINLPGSLVEEFYHSSLILPDENLVNQQLTVSSENKSEKDQEWKSLGENKKNILIVTSYSEVVHLPDLELDFLTGILSACKLSMADVAVVNINHYKNANYKELVTFFKSKIVLLFDVDPVSFGLPMNFPHYQIQPFAGNSFLYSPSLKELESDKVLKSKLWVCLKRLFNL